MADLRSSHGKQLCPPRVGHETGAERKDGRQDLYQAQPLERSSSEIQRIDGSNQKVCREQDGDDFAGGRDGRLVEAADVECSVSRGFFLSVFGSALFVFH
jgi:hypothetical protein